MTAPSSDAAGRVALLAGPGAFGGAQRHLLSLLEHLPAASGRDAALLAVGPVDPQLAAGAAAAGAPLEELPAPDGDGDGLQRALQRALQRVGAAALHLNATDPWAEVALLRAALATGLPTTAVVHLTGRWSRTQRPADADALLRQLRAVLAPSRAIAEALVEQHGLDRARVVHVPNGVAVPAAPLRAAGAPPAAPLRVACLSRLTPQKGVDVLVDAVALLPAGTVEVVVAGEGREAAALEQRAAGLPVHLAGFSAATAEVLAGADAYVQPSRDDALPLALLEAAGSGLPCAATAVGDVASEVGDVVLVVPPEDPPALAGALARLAAEPDLRERLAAAGRARVLARFTEEAFAARTAAALAPAWAAAAAA
ncbi:glycosyltransferase family 4 protein [Quadrisphaera sp. KR29]|uniref:glycosyltransferase family 4 protein n=1 Tax=Quadrisphaera sp. KR29 TaxID=3461391 RepID=UPI0040450A59